ncbi:MAG: AAA family ATPase [Leptospiraceae bacterium]|nr:AAA family ATPase [Leptospiraceae bacterium]MCP5500276.1 AAA family ATPase [Leptospiraceae bacterium]
MKYNFIVAEGFDGSGKSTLAKWIAEELGYEYHKTPMGIFADLRTHLDTETVNLEERYCFYAADCMRASLYITEKIKNGGKIILDRYYYSTIAYHESKQAGISQKLPGLFSPLLKPDLILYVKTSFPLTLERMKLRQNSPDDELFLTETLYNRIDKTFLSVFDSKYELVDNTGNLDNTQKSILKLLE